MIATENDVLPAPAPSADSPAARPVPARRPAGSAADRPAAERALALLAGGVPLSLLLDLAAAVPSPDLYRAEAGDTTWLRAVSA